MFSVLVQHSTVIPTTETRQERKREGFAIIRGIPEKLNIKA